MLPPRIGCPVDEPRRNSTMGPGRAATCPSAFGHANTGGSEGKEGNLSQPSRKLTVTCPCGARFSVPLEMAGKKGRCPKCNSVFTVPKPAQPVVQAILVDPAQEQEAQPAVTLGLVPQPGEVVVLTVEIPRAGGRVGNRVAYAGADGNPVQAEEAALECYASIGYQGIWSENDYWWQIMSLLFWDVLFARIDGAFTPRWGFPSRRQDMPRDLFTEDFYDNRQDIIRNRMAELAHVDSIERALTRAHKQNHGKPCRPIEDWGQFSLGQLVAGVQSLPRQALLQILHRLLRDFDTHRSGLPDLFLCAPHPCFVEVKAETDSLRDNQVEWLHFLAQTLGLRAGVLLINHSGRKVRSVTRMLAPAGSDVTITFGWSSSTRREEAIALARELPTYSCEGEGKQALHTVVINTADVGHLMPMLDYTGRWKSQRVSVHGQEIEPHELRGALGCYCYKVEEGLPPEYCRTRDDQMTRKNAFGCRNLRFAINSMGITATEKQATWTEYGYVDTERGEWVFDKAGIHDAMESQLPSLSLCPVFRKKAVRRRLASLLQSLPDRVNPRTDASWAFIDGSWTVWFYHERQWRSQSDSGAWPGYAMMVGVRRFSAQDRRQALSCSKDPIVIRLDVTPEAPIRPRRPTGVPSRRSGCLGMMLLAALAVATAAWGLA